MYLLYVCLQYIGKRFVVVILCLSAVAAICCAVYYHYYQERSLAEPEPEDLLREQELRSLENELAEALQEDKGMGCEIVPLDPFAKEFTQFDEVVTKIKCTGRDWVKCYHSKCKMVDEVRQTLKKVKCKIEDILYVTDDAYAIGPPTFIKGNIHYELVASDHIRVQCAGVSKKGKWLLWSGNALGFRSSVHPRAPPPGRENSYNVVILAFDSTALNGFIRLMPRSWKVLTEELGATVMTGYNILGDGTQGALFPILTGKIKLELPDASRKQKHNRNVDSFPFIFYKLKEDGYRTAYFEDMPNAGTFQWSLNGWRHQPTDHYLWAFMKDAAKKWHGGKKKKEYYCVGDTPTFKMMMNITEQFMRLDGKRFVFTFIADITHERTVIQVADDDVSEFLRRIVKYSEDTLLVVMGDHGPRYGSIRNTLAGKLSERLPLMALLLPKSLTRERPQALTALQKNSDVLTTPHDLHATILDVLGMRRHWNKYKVPGSDNYRGLTMLEPIPRNRTCSEAGLTSHWCMCVVWDNVSTSDPMYQRTAEALLEYINSLVQEANGLCEPRTLSSVEQVLRQRPNRRLRPSAGFDWKNHSKKFSKEVQMPNDHYQVKITVGPGVGMYEASMTYIVSENRFSIKPTDISRTNYYGRESHCINAIHSHLNKYCFCKNTA